MIINDRSKGTIMKSNRLFEKLDKLDSYTVEDPNEEITVDCIQIFSRKKRLCVDLYDLPDKSLKIFNVNDVILGYIYFQKSNCNNAYDELFGNFNNDSESDKISKVSIHYVNEDLMTINVSWNSLIYELDSGYNILLFMGTLFNEKGI